MREVSPRGKATAVCDFRITVYPAGCRMRVPISAAGFIPQNGWSVCDVTPSRMVCV